MCIGNIYVNELYGHDVGRIQAQLMHELAVPDVFLVSLMYVCLRLKAGCFIWISSVSGRKYSAQACIICVQPMSYMLEYNILGYALYFCYL